MIEKYRSSFAALGHLELRLILAATVLAIGVATAAVFIAVGPVSSLFAQIDSAIPN